MRDPHAYTPMLEEGVGGAPPRSLTLGADLAMNQAEIGKFSQKDAQVIKHKVIDGEWLTVLFLIITEKKCLFSLLTLQSYFAPFSYSPTFLHPPSPLTHSLTCFQAFSDFIAHLDKLAGAIHPLLDAPPVDIPGATAGSLRKRLAAAKTLRPIIKCGEFSYTVRLTHSVPALFSVVTKS